MYRTFSGGVKYGLIHRRTFGLIRGAAVYCFGMRHRNDDILSVACWPQGA